MPSKSYVDFLELLTDVKKLQETHYSFCEGKVGRKNLGFITRSAVVMLCAAWERYNENLLLEIIEKILDEDISANDLPTPVKKNISYKVRKHKNEIYPIELADGGWKNLWKGYATNDTELLHTPNSKKLSLLFKQNIGIEDYTSFWTHDSVKQIDNFVKARGEIAHNGSKAKYVRIDSLRRYLDLTIDNAMEIDFKVQKYLNDQYGILAWETLYHRTIDKYS